MPNLLMSYPGSKAKLARWYATLFPPSPWFVSAFAGTAAELLYRKPMGTEVLNDIDGDIHNLFAVVRDPRKCSALKRLLLATLDGRQQFAECKGMLDSPDPVRRAWAFATVANTGNVRSAVRRRSWGNAKHRLYWLPDHLEWWCERLQLVKLECLPWQEVIDRYDRDDAFLFCDPPYHPNTCNGSEKQYRHVMSAQEHGELLVRLKRCRARVLVCGYSQPTYDDLLADWVQLETTTRCRMGYCGPRTERVWMNYDPPSGGRING